MLTHDISHLRLMNQRVSATEFGTASDVVRWMGAMQAQDYAMAKWAVGVRLQNPTDEAVEAAFDRGDIVRTHVMRPTWHFVHAHDIGWMLKLTAPHVLSSLRSRHRDLELSDEVVLKSKNILVAALEGGTSLTREALAGKFERAGIRTDENRLSHLMMHAELDGLMCSGPMMGKKHTYMLMEERVPGKTTYTRDESLAELARRYFTSHGPATLSDFAWWSGLPMPDARRAREMVRANFIGETIGDQEYLLPHSSAKLTCGSTSVHLLPAYDEFLISYRDRSASLTLTHNKKMISDNGIFRPVVVVNGQVTGLWKRTTKRDAVIIETEYFHPHHDATKRIVEDVAKGYGHFSGKDARVQHG